MPEPPSYLPAVGHNLRTLIDADRQSHGHDEIRRPQPERFGYVKDVPATIAAQLINRASGVGAILSNFSQTVGFGFGSDSGPKASSAGAFDETDDLRACPAGDPLACRIVMPVQNAVFRHIDPSVGRVLPARELAADKSLKMTVHDTIPDGSAIRAVAAGQVGLRLTKASIPRREIRVGTGRGRRRYPYRVRRQQAGRCDRQNSRRKPSCHLRPFLRSPER